MRPLMLGDDPADTPAAVMLAHRHQVAIRCLAESPSAHELRRAGFMPLVDELHCLHLTERKLPNLARRQRKTVRLSLASWQRLGWKLDVCTPMEYGEDRLVERFYYELLVPHLYATGRSPFGTHNEPSFRRLLPGAIVVLAHQGRSVRAGAILHPRDLSHLVVPGLSVEERRRALVGTVYALHPDGAEVTRAWKYLLTQAAAAAGSPVLSMGADDPMVDGGYLPVLSDKVRWADRIGYALGETRLFASIQAPGAPDRSRLAGLLLAHSRPDNLAVVSTGLSQERRDEFCRRLLPHVRTGDGTTAREEPQS